MACETWNGKLASTGSVAGAALLAAALVLTVGCGGKVAMVKAAQAEMQPISRTVSTNGRVELTEDFQAHAMVPAQVKQILVKLGDKVRQGQELIRLEDSDAHLRVANATVALENAANGVSNIKSGGSADEMLTAKADMTAAQLNLQQTNSRLNTLQALQAKGAASASEVTAAQLQVTEARNRVAALQARSTGRYSSADLALQEQQVTRSRAEMASARSDLANFNIRAPFAGTVYGLAAEPYAQVSLGQDLVNVADLTKIRVRAFFDEPEIGRLAVGQPVRITWEAKPEKTWHGHIAVTPTSITNYGTRNVGECLITVDDSNGDLIPNVNVTLYVTTVHRDNVLTIPHEALRSAGTGNYVYKIVDGKLQRVPVTVDVVSQTRAQITSGINIGDQVVLVPMNDVELKDGLSVRVQP